MDLSIERRRNPRVRVKGEISVFHGGGQVDGRAVDISASGVAFLSPDRGSTASSINAELTLPRVVGSLPFTGIVVRSELREGDYLWAVWFQSMASWVSAVVETYVRKQIRGRIPSLAQADEEESIAGKASVAGASRLDQLIRAAVMSVRSEVGRETEARSGAPGVGPEVRTLFKSAVDSVGRSSADSRKPGKK